MRAERCRRPGRGHAIPIAPRATATSGVPRETAVGQRRGGEREGRERHEELERLVDVRGGERRGNLP